LVVVIIDDVEEDYWNENAIEDNVYYDRSFQLCLCSKLPWPFILLRDFQYKTIITLFRK